MEIIEYSSKYKQDCLNLFLSNQDKYFDPSEYQDFDIFLTQEIVQSCYFVVVDNGKVKGCGGYGYKNGVAFLRWGIVGREYQNSKIGTLLLEYRIAEIKKTFGATRIKISTSQHAQDFFKRFGFQIDNVIKDGLAAGLDKVMMTLKH